MFSQTAEYALRAMACLALDPQERLPSGVLAERTQVPPDYLAKVLQLLAGAGLIEGRRGVGGGYRMTKAPNQVQLFDVVNAVAPLERITTCPLGIKDHGKRLCPLHRTVDLAIKAVIDVLDERTLADLILQPGENTPLCDTQTTVSLSVKSRKPG